MKRLFFIGLLLIPSFGIAQLQKLNAACAPAVSRATLDINHVRSVVNAGGSLWWNPTGFGYQCPKWKPGNTSVKNVIKYGSLWYAGVDANGLLRGAAQVNPTFSQLGTQFWAGPLDRSTATTDPTTCSKFDQLWKISREEIELHKNAFGGGTTPAAGYTPPAAFINWPAFDDNGSPLAPFYDIDGDRRYNAWEGDYPYIKGDQEVYTVFNDEGGYGKGIGIDVQLEAYAYADFGDARNATYYNYTLVNRSSNYINQMSVGFYIDADLGNPNDDFAGCDPLKNTLYFYNGDAVDEGPNGFGNTPPVLCVQGIEGMESDPFNRIDDDHDGLVDEIDSTTYRPLRFYEKMDITGCVIFDQVSSSQRGLPTTLTEVRNYLTGKWKDGTVRTFGGNGYAASGTPNPFLYAGNPTTANSWMEVNQANRPGDRQGLLCWNSFTYKPGQVKFLNIQVGMYQPLTNNPKTAIANALVQDSLLKFFNDSLFHKPHTWDVNQMPKQGPDAPTAVTTNLAQMVRIAWSNQTGNNVGEQFTCLNDHIGGVGFGDPYYRFQGYLVYQVKGTTTEAYIRKYPNTLLDTSQFRLVFQTDKKDAVTNATKFVVQPNIQMGMPLYTIRGSNQGITRSANVTQDAFTGRALIPGNSYKYLVVAYAYNNYLQYNLLNNSGQDEQFLIGTGNLKFVYGTPLLPTAPNDTMSSRKVNKQPLGISIFPNPATDVLTLENLPYGSEVQLLTLSGKCLLKQREAEGSVQFTLSDGRFAAGFYLVCITDVDGNVEFKKVMIVR